MYKHNLQWLSGDSYLTMTNWDKNKEDTVYFSRGTYGDINYARRDNRIILKWSDYM